MKYLMNEDSNLPTDMLYGVRSAYPGLYVNPEKNVVLLNRDRSHRVALLAGCGAGHEPYGTGFVGENCLTGFVNGSLFDSPSIASICLAIKHLAEWNKGGILLLLLNNSCSKLSFGVAVTRAREAGVKIESVVMCDDCSMAGADQSKLEDDIASRRTLSACAIYCKVLGGLSASGRSLEELLWEERLLKARTASACVAYSSASLPGRTRPHFRLRRGALCLGVGTNAEDGGHFVFKYRPIHEVIEPLVDRLLPRCLLRDRGSVVVLVNSLGSLTKMESYIIGHHATNELEKRGLKVVRLYVGQVTSCANMKGFTLSLANVTENALWLEMLDLETEAFAWPGSRLSRPARWPPRQLARGHPPVSELVGRELGHHEISELKNCITSVCKALIISKRELDSLCHGTYVELGSEMFRFAEATLKKMKADCGFLNSLQNAFLGLSLLAEETMSTSAAGSIYSLLLLGAALGAGGTWPEIWESAVLTLSKYTSAKIGHRSLVDALVPACGVFRRVIERDGEECWRAALKAAVETAEEACIDTKSMVSKASESPFFQKNKEGVEAGARAVVVVLRALYVALCPSLEQPGTQRQGVRVSSIYFPRESNRESLATH